MISLALFLVVFGLVLKLLFITIPDWIRYPFTMFLVMIWLVFLFNMMGINVFGFIPIAGFICLLVAVLNLLAKKFQINANQ
jgi:hypothetical protein